MRCIVRQLAVVLCAVGLAACSRPAPTTAQAASSGNVPTTQPRGKRGVRLTGTVQAVHFSKVLVPAIFGRGGSLTLTRIIPNGSKVKEGDLIAEFDATTQIDEGRDAQAKFDDLGHQAEQRRAQNRADAEKRASDLKQAEA